MITRRSIKTMHGRNSQPTDNGTSRLAELEDALHFARKYEQRVWGSGEHEAARAEVERLETLIEAPFFNQNKY